MDKHIIRQTILRSLQAHVHPGAARVELIATIPDLLIRAVTRADLVDILQGLADHGYLQNLRPGREPLYKLTAAAIDQIDQETDLDQYIWGDAALS